MCSHLSFICSDPYVVNGAPYSFDSLHTASCPVHETHGYSVGSKGLVPFDCIPVLYVVKGNSLIKNNEIKGFYRKLIKTDKTNKTDKNLHCVEIAPIRGNIEKMIHVVVMVSTARSRDVSTI